MRDSNGVELKGCGPGGCRVVPATVVDLQSLMGVADGTDHELPHPRPYSHVPATRPSYDDKGFSSPVSKKSVEEPKTEDKNWPPSSGLAFMLAGNKIFTRSSARRGILNIYNNNSEELSPILGCLPK